MEADAARREQEMTLLESVFSCSSAHPFALPPPKTITGQRPRQVYIGWQLRTFHVFHQRRPDSPGAIKIVPCEDEKNARNLCRSVQQFPVPGEVVKLLASAVIPDEATLEKWRGTMKKPQIALLYHGDHLWVLRGDVKPTWHWVIIQDRDERNTFTAGPFFTDKQQDLYDAWLAAWEQRWVWLHVYNAGKHANDFYPTFRLTEPCAEFPSQHPSSSSSSASLSWPKIVK